MSLGPQGFSDDDRSRLAAQGVDEAEAARQLALLASPPPPVRLDRPCTSGDGILALPTAARPAALAAHAQAAHAGRITTFVPASGAATRMFKDLLAAESSEGPLLPADVRARAAQGDAAAGALAQFAESLPAFAFADALAAQLAARGLDAGRVVREGPWRALLEALLSPEGLDYARAPKGLLAFHRDPDAPGRTRTAFEEHLREALELVGDGARRARLHLTVSPEHQRGFESVLTASRAALETGGRVLDVTFSQQQPSTDTLAASPAGGPFRDAQGALVFRPAGHGALLANLEALAGDLVFIKNIDNIAVDRARGEGLAWARLLLGLVAQWSEQGHALVRRLREGGDPAAMAEAAAFVREHLGEAPPGQRDARAWLLARLARPWRVAGMVANTGEPGGGPFWVLDAAGERSAQIVESAQVDAGSGEQMARFRGGTHFNPVFLACALRDADGRPYRLTEFVDERAVIVTRKSHGGRELLALERPGLWNGAMAGWNTVFVEVPLAVFDPVKTVFDLLRPAHQAH